MTSTTSRQPLTAWQVILYIAATSMWCAIRESVHKEIVSQDFNSCFSMTNGLSTCIAHFGRVGHWRGEWTLSVLHKNRLGKALIGSRWLSLFLCIYPAPRITTMSSALNQARKRRIQILCLHSFVICTRHLGPSKENWYDFHLPLLYSTWLAIMCLWNSPVPQPGSIPAVVTMSTRGTPSSSSGASVQ